MAYQLQRSIPYEGVITEDFAIIGDALQRILDCRWSLEDVELLEVKHLDVYSLMRNFESSRGRHNHKV